MMVDHATSKLSTDFLARGTVCLSMLVLLIATAAGAAPVGTAFTYQGQLKFSGALVANSQCYFTFRLYDALTNGTLIGQVPLSGIGQQGTPVAVSNGLFTADIDFGDGAFTGSARWMETSVCCLAFPFPVGTTCTQTTLSPRQPVNAVPYALGLRLPTAETATTSQPGIWINNTAQGTGLMGTSNGCQFPEGCVGGAGVVGENTADGDGVRGSSQFGFGVYGSGSDAGVKGQSANGNGVTGESAFSGASGVYGENTGQGYGVAGRTMGNGTAVLGDNTSTSGWAGYFNGRLGITGVVRSNGGYLTGGADLAERIQSVESLEPGDVVEIDPRRPDRFRRTSAPYSTRVAGIISTAPGVTLNSHETPEGAAPSLALAGRVPVKVTAANGAIELGDLLTPSALPGHAMRCIDHSKCAGAIVGKALETLRSGTGTVTALITLQ